MDLREQEEFSKVRELLQTIADGEAMQRAARLYDLGMAAFKSKSYAVSMAEMEAVLEIDDPYYSANALWTLFVIYRQVGDHPQVQATLKRIVSLRPESRRFIDPGYLGVAYIKLGDAQKAIEYYSLAIKLNGESLALLANLAEAYVVAGDHANSLALSEKLIPQGEIKYALIGRIFKGATLWFMNQSKEALNEFQFVGNYLVATGGIPKDFDWDFGDSEGQLNRVDSPLLRAVLNVLSRKIDFTAFRQAWSGPLVTV